MIEVKPTLISHPIHNDNRGAFEKLFDRSFLNLINQQKFKVEQVNRSVNKSMGTVRGLHFQYEKFADAKIISVLSGKICDFVLDVRQKSPTAGKLWTFELSDEAHQSLFVPAGFAHGFQTLVDNAEILYLHDKEHIKAAERGINILDPALKIKLPLPITEMSDRDRGFSNFNEVYVK